MRAVAIFVSRFALGFLLLSVCSLGLLLIPVAPGLMDTEIAGVVIGQGETHLRISVHQFSCATGNRGALSQCEIVLEGRPLEVSVIYANNFKDHITGCQAFYAGKAVDCSSGFVYAGRKGILPYVRVEHNLGLSNQQLQRLRQANLAENFGENNWLRLATGISLAAATLAIILLYLQIRKWADSPASARGALGQLLYQPIEAVNVFYCLGIGVIVFGLSWYSLVFGLLCLGFVD
jgi:hypothetical protein